MLSSYTSQLEMKDSVVTELSHMIVLRFRMSCVQVQMSSEKRTRQGDVISYFSFLAAISFMQ